MEDEKEAVDDRLRWTIRDYPDEKRRGNKKKLKLKVGTRGKEKRGYYYTKWGGTEVHKHQK